ncbi:MAG TPA: hypothetical protein VM537_26960 [Anaerolineae bacterium]|nr:hypothetical protein [Anaerolineae bacterium]
MPEESSGIQRAGAITYYLLLRWMAGAESITTSQIASHIEVDYHTAHALMEDLGRLPFFHRVEGYHSAGLDFPMWGIRSIAPRELSVPCRASLVAYLLVYTTLACDMGITVRQLCSLLGLKRDAVLNMLDHLSAADSTTPIYCDGPYWKAVTCHWVIARKHDTHLQ